MVTNLRDFVYLMDVNVHVKFQLDTTTRTYFFGRGAQCAPPPPPWFLEHQKSLVWIGLTQQHDIPGNLCNVGIIISKAVIAIWHTNAIMRPPCSTCHLLLSLWPSDDPKHFLLSSADRLIAAMIRLTLDLEWSALVRQTVGALSSFMINFATSLHDDSADGAFSGILTSSMANWAQATSSLGARTRCINQPLDGKEDVVSRRRLLFWYHNSWMSQTTCIPSTYIFQATQISTNATSITASIIMNTQHH